MSAQQTTTQMMTEIVSALERRFPNHNGPFEYVSRLCEEVGELLQAVDENDTGHILHEAEDVLRVVIGIAGVYSRTSSLNINLSEASTPSIPRERVALTVAVSASEVARAVHHAEGTGIKNAKHTSDAYDELDHALQNMSATIASIVHAYTLPEQFDAQVLASYQRFQANGYL